MVTIPGDFQSFGHDYRADTARFVRDAFHLPATSDDQMERIEKALRTLELDRSERIKASHIGDAPPAPAENGGRWSGGQRRSPPGCEEDKGSQLAKKLAGEAPHLSFGCSDRDLAR